MCIHTVIESVMNTAAQHKQFLSYSDVHVHIATYMYRYTDTRVG